MGLIYISIPMHRYHYEEQRKKAAKIQNLLGKENTLNPFELSEQLEHEFKCRGLGTPRYADYLVNDISVLANCDAILMCEGWENGKGCVVEKTFAEAIGLKVIYEDELLKKPEQ